MPPRKEKLCPSKWTFDCPRCVGIVALDCLSYEISITEEPLEKPFPSRLRAGVSPVDQGHSVVKVVVDFKMV